MAGKRKSEGSLGDLWDEDAREKYRKGDNSQRMAPDKMWSDTSEQSKDYRHLGASIPSSSPDYSNAKISEGTRRESSSRRHEADAKDYSAKMQSHNKDTNPDRREWGKKANELGRKSLDNITDWVKESDAYFGPMKTDEDDEKKKRK